MCIGLPLRIVQSHDFTAVAEGRGLTRDINLFLTGPQPVGTWVLVMQGSAHQVLTPEHAAMIDDALDAVEAAMRGDPVSGHFADLPAPSPAPATPEERFPG
ncbi:MAG: HypC/HybG/HupF family hydrogenase formation chaperone [Rhodospirillaceae bacterium]